VNSENSFAFSIGGIDGLITSLMITSNAIITQSVIGFDTALRISFGSAIVGAASFFVAEFGELSKDERRVAKHLNPNLLQSEHRNKFFKRNLEDAFRGGSVSLFMGFIGASVPIVSYSMLMKYSSLSLLFSYISLGLLGIYLGKTSGGKVHGWFMALIILGILMTIAGYFLRIVS
jgi:VIT1/CCC1 family predicted Fe2+/Mn2+ transporter